MPHPEAQDVLPPEVAENWMLLAEVQEKLRIGRAAVTTLCKDGKLSSRKYNRRTVVNRRSVEMYLDSFEE